jgi:hypothetical protein
MVDKEVLKPNKEKDNEQVYNSYINEQKETGTIKKKYITVRRGK